MISAFAKAAQILDEPRYLAAAQRADGFHSVADVRRRRPATLLRRYRDGDAAIPGFLDDYAFFIAALLDLYEADFDPRHIENCDRSSPAKCASCLKTPADGAFFSTAAGDRSLVLRMKDDYDGAEPSGNSDRAAGSAAPGAHHRSRRLSRSRRANAARPRVRRSPQQPVAVAANAGRARLLPWPPRREVVIAGAREPELTRAFLRRIRARFLPHTITLLVDSTSAPQARRFFPAAADMREIDGQPTAYVCENYACQLPTNERCQVRRVATIESKIKFTNHTEENSWKDLEQRR